jgi:CRP-like cAMP-binding protein
MPSYLRRLPMNHKTEIHPTLQSIPWLMDISPVQMKNLEDISGFRYLGAGEVLFQEGDNDNLVFIVSEGRLSVEILVPGHGQVCIYYAEPLDVIGWDRLTPVARQRITTITAVKNSNLIYFDATALSKLCKEDTNLGYIIMQRLANVITSRMLSMRIKLMDLIVEK